MKRVVSGIAICAMAFSVGAKDVDAGQVVQDSLFNGIYAGLGVGGSFLKADGSVEEDGFRLSSDMEADRFMGSAVVGAGKVINKVYGGFEVLLDIMKNKKKQMKDSFVYSDKTSGVGTADVDMKGYIPQINLKAGYSFSHDTLVYGKVGCSWSKISSTYVHKEKEEDPAVSSTSSKTRASIVLGVGAEKVFSNRFSTSLEVDYNFGGRATSSNTSTTGEGDKQETTVTDTGTLHWSKGWNIRALAKYNVKI